MKTFKCQCDNILFFDSRKCVTCNALTWRCPNCQHVTASRNSNAGAMQCGNPECGLALKPCQNSTQFAACNMAIAADETNQVQCRYCRLNRLLPDLSISACLEQWKRLEAAKHRTLAAMEAAGFSLLNLPSSVAPLSFEFKDDVNGPVVTGHLKGCITIHLKEADSVFREVNRVEFGEPQRTLIGHFRHELGHYYWDALVAPSRLKDFRRLFGNESNQAYNVAIQNYYNSDPPADWSSRFVSAYASMHPWEDFAETFGLYLDLCAVLATEAHFSDDYTNSSNFASMLQRYRDIGVRVNELNRDMGLQDLVPEVLNDTIADKLGFVHSLRN